MTLVTVTLNEWYGIHAYNREDMALSGHVFYSHYAYNNPYQPPSKDNSIL